MKKTYIIPALQIDMMEAEESLLTVSYVATGDPFSEGDEVTADAPEMNWGFED